MGWEGDAEWRENITQKELFVSGVQGVFFSGRKDAVDFSPRLFMHPSKPKVTVIISRWW